MIFLYLAIGIIAFGLAVMGVMIWASKHDFDGY